MSKFCAFILTHKRSHISDTYDSLRKFGYHGDIKVIIDDSDPEGFAYIKKYPNELYIFNKEKAIEMTDDGDNFESYNAVVYARNMTHQIAKELGYDYFIVLDDDYKEFRYIIKGDYTPIDRYRPIKKNLDKVFEELVKFMEVTEVTSIAMAQGGDFIGGVQNIRPKRKCMNSFVCATERPFQFYGKINEDVTAYVKLGSVGHVFLTATLLSLEQGTTQANAGGLTDIYLDQGTYVKSFYSVMYNPSSVKVAVLKDRKNPRLHHRVKWDHAVPKILRQDCKNK